MPSLTSSLVKHGVASAQDVDAALARQMSHGGDLMTCLLEIAPVTEAALAPALAAASGLRPAPRGRLPAAPAGLGRLLSEDLMTRHVIYPMAERDGVLVLAVAERLPSEVEADLEFLLGLELDQRVAPVARLREAIAREHGLKLEPRLAALIERLDGDAPAAENSAVEAPLSLTLGNLPTAPALPGVAFPGVDTTTPAAAEHTAPALPPPAEPAASPAPRPVPDATSRAPAAPATPASALEPPASTTEALTAPVSPESLRQWTRHARRRPPLGSKPRGPYTPAMLETDLLASKAPSQVLRAAMRFASQYFDYTAVFSVNAGIAEGRDAQGPGADKTHVAELGIPLELPSLLSRAHATRSYVLEPLAGGTELDALLQAELRRPGAATVLVLPIVARDRVLVLIYGDGGQDDVSLEDVGELIAMMPSVGSALERIVHERKAAGAVQRAALPIPSGSLSAARRRHRERLPSTAERSQALLEALSPRPPAVLRREPASLPAPVAPPSSLRTHAPPKPSAAPAPQAPQHAASEAPTAGGPREPLQRSTLRPPTAAASDSPLGSAGAPSMASAKRFDTLPPDSSTSARRQAAVMPVISLRRREGQTPPQGTPRVADSDLPPLPLLRRPGSLEPPEASLGTPPEAAPTLPRLPSQSPGAPPSTLVDASPRAPRSARKTLQLVLSDEPELDDGPSIDVDEDDEALDASLLEALLQEDSSPDISVGVSHLDEDLLGDELPEVPLAAASRAEAYPAIQPARRHSSAELGLPSVIIEREPELARLVRELTEGEPRALEQLARLGSRAAGALIAQFPGPLSPGVSLTSLADTASVADAGPVLAALLRLGDAATPFVLARTADGAPEVRAWASRLLGELGTPEAAPALVQRFTDSEALVRRAAFTAARRLYALEEPRAALRHLLYSKLNDPRQPLPQRLGAIEALTQLRDGRAVPQLFPLLSDTTELLVRSAHWALVALTGVDHGRSSSDWTAWWDQHGDRDRVEWLIDALLQEDSELRRKAAEALTVATQRKYPPLERASRETLEALHAQELLWWQTTGRQPKAPSC